MPQTVSRLQEAIIDIGQAQQDLRAAYLGGAPFVGEQVFGLTPKQVGYWFAAPSIGYLLGNFLSARFSPVMGLNRMILIGAITCLVALSAALLVDPTQKDRSIGVKFSATVAAGAGKKIGLQLSIAQYQQ